ncbi:hypothetical protein ACVWWP_000815 [Bradyrhizobium sp. LM3.6]
MTLTSSRFIGHEQDRGIVQFSMQDGAKQIACAISTSAMDDLERGPRARPSEREEQFTPPARAHRSLRGTEISGDGVRGHPAGHRVAEH